MGNNFGLFDWPDPPPELDESHAATRYRVAYMTRDEWQEYERAVFDEACNKGVEE